MSRGFRTSTILFLILFRLFSLEAESLAFRLIIPEGFKLSIPGPNWMSLVPVEGEASGSEFFIWSEGAEKQLLTIEVSDQDILLDWNVCDPHNPQLNLEPAELLPEVFLVSLDIVICSEDSTNGSCSMVSREFLVDRKKQVSDLIEIEVEFPEF